MYFDLFEFGYFLGIYEKLYIFEIFNQKQKVAYVVLKSIKN